jgi:DNA-binding response OmpR family regulator
MFKKSIAIIDDDPDLLNLFSEALQMSGYTVSSFADPLLAYQHIQEINIEFRKEFGIPDRMAIPGDLEELMDQ